MSPARPVSRVPVDFHRNGKAPPKRNRLRRLYVMLRKLVRRRQESVALRESHAAADRRVNSVVQGAERERVAFEKQLSESRNDFSHEIAALKKRLDDRDEQISNLNDRIERQKADYDEMIRSRDKKIDDLADVRIPILERKLEVEQAYSSHLAALVEKKSKHELAEIAVTNQRIAAAENSQAQIPIAGIRLSGERSL